MNRSEVTEAIGRALSGGGGLNPKSKKRSTSLEHFQESVNKLRSSIEMAVRKKQLIEEVVELVEKNAVCQKMLDLLDEASAIDTDD